MRGARLPSALLLGLALAQTPAFAAEPVASDVVDMAPAVASALNEVIALMDQQQLDAAAAAVQRVRGDLFAGMSNYEKMRTLQLSANVNALLQRHAEASADYEAILQLDGLSDADRLSAARLAAETYLQQQNWQKGAEHLLTANELQDGRDAETLLRLAFAYSQFGRPAEALPYMEQRVALAGAAASEEDQSNLALLYIQANAEAKAIETYEKLLEQFPSTPNRESISANLAALYIKVGNNAKAQSLLRMLLREYPSSSQAPVWRQSLTAIGG